MNTTYQYHIISLRFLQNTKLVTSIQGNTEKRISSLNIQSILFDFKEKYVVSVLYHFTTKKSIHLPIFMQICYNAFGGRCYGRKETKETPTLEPRQAKPPQNEAVYCHAIFT